MASGGCAGNFPSRSAAWQPAVQGIPELDVATGAVRRMATDGPSLCGFASPFLNLLEILTSGAPCDSDFHGLIMPRGEKGLCSLV